jgi:hypothetical protein
MRGGPCSESPSLAKLLVPVARLSLRAIYNVRVLSLVVCLVSASMAWGQNGVLIRTFANPTPHVGDNFGAWLVSLASDRVLIGAPYADVGATNGGAVYLFHTNGTMILAITNPSPAYTSLGGFVPGDGFGSALSLLGTDRVIVGSPFNNGPDVIYVGTVYLFSTNGTLLTTITNPHPTNPDKFGSAVAALGSDRIVVGATDYEEDPDIDLVGIAYLFRTNGTLLATFQNPNRNGLDRFGFSVAALGTDRVLVGTASEEIGTVYMFNTNGTLLTVFTNPVPSFVDYFGLSIAVRGTDRILIGAPLDDKGGEDAGAIYVFNTNGTLLTTITNPAPVPTDRFGERLSIVGGDRVLTASPRTDLGAMDAVGTAYILSLTGTLLVTLTNPTPAAGDLFGSHAAAIDSDHVIIGAYLENTGATDAGAAYLFSIPPSPAPPTLGILRTVTNTVVVSWPLAATNFVLQQNTNGISSLNWSNVTSATQTNGTNRIIVSSPGGVGQYYRLRAN